MNAPAGQRIAALDLIRGIAILGILAINIEGFAGPIAATVSPAWNGPVGMPDSLAFAVVTVLFEGKMRALLSLLFGASMLLFIEGVEAKGGCGDAMQLRRLIWLAAIGYLHFMLLWWGDILFTYALAGFFALMLRHLPARSLVPAALLAFTAWHGAGMAGSIEPVLAESRLLSGTSIPSERKQLEADRAEARQDAVDEVAREKGSAIGLIGHKLAREADFPLNIALNTLGETLPLMLIGMALHRSGFFTGGWPVRRLKLLAAAGIGLGGSATLALTVLAASRGYPPALMNAILAWWMAYPHLAMGLGYAAALVLFARGYRGGWLGKRIEAVGKMALSNYLGCTLVFTGLFYGWGLGLMGRVPEHWYWAFVLAGWIVMLGWSTPWLARFRQGPVEWAWRSLTWSRRMPLHRSQS